MDRINTAVRAGPPVNDLVTLLAVCQTPGTSPASRPKWPSKSC
jgi:hypothetical protein